MKMTRFNFALPVSVKQWLENESEATGISQANLVLIALKTYIDQQNMMKVMGRLEALESKMILSDDVGKSK